MKWLPVQGWSYEVSNSGKVRRAGTRVTLTPMLTGAKQNQYETVLLCGWNKQRAAKVHRLVAEAFLGPAPEGKPLVLHRDGNRRNNRPGNLYYGSQSDNMRDMRKHHQHRHKLTLRQVEQIRRRRAKGEKGRELAEEFGVSEQYICDIHRGRK